jgi:hypothetical protein
MSKVKIFGLVFVAIVIISAFLPWLRVESKHIMFTGLDTAGSSFGEPGKLNIIMAVITGILFLVPGRVAPRLNLFSAAFMSVWAFRNFLLFSRCEMGECPDRGIGLDLSLIAALAAFVCVLLCNAERKETKA